jgi:8-oxo-dGTP pyrophosphatase MutT (NUDIX family)
MTRIIEKVTAFVTRGLGVGRELLLFEHPYAGIQIPAGMVDPGETPEDAALREVREETGLAGAHIVKFLGVEDEKIPENSGVVIPPAVVYSRPDLTSFDWVNIRSAVQVKIEREGEGFKQITYIEPDQVPNPNYVSMQITGWIQDESLADARRRYFFHLASEDQSKDRWEVFSDNHTFSPFWASLDNLPEIISPQDEWLKFITRIIENDSN